MVSDLSTLWCNAAFSDDPRSNAVFRERTAIISLLTKDSLDSLDVSDQSGSQNLGGPRLLGQDPGTRGFFWRSPKMRLLQKGCVQLVTDAY